MRVARFAAFAAFALALPVFAQDDVRRLSRDILRKLVEIDTTEETGNTRLIKELSSGR